MKKFLLFSTISLISVAAYCVFETKNEMFKQRAFNLLTENAAQLRLAGDVKSDETLTNILSTLKDSSRHSFNCFVLDTNTAACTLIIEYSPVGETGITFNLRLDQNEMPKKIKGRIEISRGD